MRRVLMTGATGLVGRALCDQLASAGYQVRAALRVNRESPSSASEKVVVGDISTVRDWTAALDDVDLVVHAAARTHVPQERGEIHQYEATNVAATRNLATAAAAQRVKRFVYLSSIKVNGEDSGSGAFTSEGPTNPEDAYGRSKLSAELVLRHIAAASGMEYAIVRPPLVYGPGVRANFLRLMSWVDHERLLPFGAVQNRRSLINVWNLSSIVQRVLEHPLAAGRVWLAADAELLSTPELIRRLASKLERRARLLSMPIGLLKLVGGLTGYTSEVARLCGSLAIDNSQSYALGWHPRVSLDEGLVRTVAWYRGK
jgi:nucleoside-diphosphate-sugar epimerase